MKKNLNKRLLLKKIQISNLAKSAIVGGSQNECGPVDISKQKPDCLLTATSCTQIESCKSVITHCNDTF